MFLVNCIYLYPLTHSHMKKGSASRVPGFALPGPQNPDCNTQLESTKCRCMWLIQFTRFFQLKAFLRRQKLRTTTRTLLKESQLHTDLLKSIYCSHIGLHYSVSPLTDTHGITSPGWVEKNSGSPNPQPKLPVPRKMFTSTSENLFKTQSYSKCHLFK